MTVPTNPAYAEFAWTGVETNFAPGIEAQDVAHIVLSYRYADGSIIALANGVHVTLSKSGNPGETGMISGVPLFMPAAPGTLMIARKSPDTQAIAFADLGRYSALTHEKLHDSAALRSGELRRDLGRAVKAPKNEAPIDLPAAADRAGKVLFFDANGNPTAAPPSTDSTVAAQAAAAAAQAAAAQITRQVTAQTLAFGNPVQWNTALGAWAKVVATGAANLAAPTNLIPGNYGLTIVQDATGGRLLGTLDPIFDFSNTNGIIPGLNTDPNAETFYSFQYDGFKFKYVGRIPAIVECEDDGTSNLAGFVYSLRPKGGGQITKLFPGLRVGFTAPFSCGISLRVAGLSYVARSADGANILRASLRFFRADIKKSGHYTFRFETNDPYTDGVTHGPWWGLETPPVADSDAFAAQTLSYVINVDGSDTTLSATGRFRMYDPVRGTYKWVQPTSSIQADVSGAKFAASISNGAGAPGNELIVSALTSGRLWPGQKVAGAGVGAATIILSQSSGATGGVGTYIVQNLVAGVDTMQLVGGEAMTSGGSPVIDGTATPGGLPDGTVAYIGAYFPPGKGGNPDDIQFNFTNAPFTAQFDSPSLVAIIDDGTGVAGACSGVAGNKLTVSAVPSYPGNKLAIGMVLVGAFVKLGTFITGQVSGTGGGVGVYTVSQVQMLGTPGSTAGTGMTGSRKYYVDAEGAYWIDPLGNINTLLGAIIPSGGSIQSFANMAVAAAAGKVAGSVISNTPWTGYPVQPIPVTGQFSGGFTGAAYAEFDPAMRARLFSWDWRCVCRYTFSGTVWNDTAGKTTSLQVQMIPLSAYGASAAVTFLPAEFTSINANAKGSVSLVCTNANGDGAYLFKVFGKNDGGNSFYNLNVACDTVI